MERKRVRHVHVQGGRSPDGDDSHACLGKYREEGGRRRRCGVGDDARARSGTYGEEGGRMRRWGLHLRLLQQVRGGGKAEAAMGMAPALAAGGPVQRRKGVRAGRAEAAAMEEEQAVWIRRSPGTEECFR